ELVAVLAPNLNGVAEAQRGEQRGTRAGALNDRIGYQGRAMDELLHTSYGNPLPFKRFEHERFDGLRWIARRGESFANCEAAGSIVEYSEVRERASDIHSYPAMPGGTSHHSTSSLGKRRNGKISTCGERCWESRPPSTARMCPVM